MRKYINIIEMPIQNVEFIGDKKNSASLRKDDIGIVNNPKYRVKMIKLLEKSPLPINIVFLNHTKSYQDMEDIGNPDRYLGSGEKASVIMSEQQFKNTFGYDLKSDSSTLTAVFAFNEGTDRMPFTPWMIAHRLCHLVEESSPVDGRGGVAPVLMKLQEMWRNFDYDARGMLSVEWIIQDIGTTKACRDHKIVNLGEFVAECFAQYLVSGNIILNPVKEIMALTPFTDTHRMYPKLYANINGTAKVDDSVAATKMFNNWARYAENAFLVELKKLVGKIVVM